LQEHYLFFKRFSKKEKAAQSDILYTRLITQSQHEVYKAYNLLTWISSLTSFYTGVMIIIAGWAWASSTLTY